MSKVRAKFSCTRVSEDSNGYKDAEFSAVYSEDESENADFAKATPSGEVKIQISPDVPASNFFKPGKNYYLDFTEAPE